MSKMLHLTLMVLLITLQTASAESKRLPSVEEVSITLIRCWEQTIRQDPSTKAFHKTETPGVYYINTSILPYEGRVQVLNLVVDRYKPVGMYDRTVIYGGVIETKLLDAPNIAQEQPFSFDKWQRMGWFDYDGKTNQWFAFNSWDEHFPISERNKQRIENKT